MKTRTKTFIGILAVVALAAGLSLLAGCAQEDDPESIEDVINKFVAAVNAENLEDVKECLDPAAIASATALIDKFFDTWFTDPPYSKTAYDESGNTATVELTSDDPTAVPLDLVFTMVDGDDTYYITTIENSAGAVIFE